MSSRRLPLLLPSRAFQRVGKFTIQQRRNASNYQQFYCICCQVTKLKILERPTITQETHLIGYVTLNSLGFQGDHMLCYN